VLGRWETLNHILEGFENTSTTAQKAAEITGLELLVKKHSFLMTF